ncbi:Planctomycete cytochrome C [Planctomycetes bacterium Poly30]|uniref:Planctomycete cytochrome C n=1 Tax=Saltatorellus ferox TaxID=2528018 RepID=A0A518EZM1_9BACT|nr:Planctomycete cytochrome C [Planctomycetes bacterium Poly30]
MLVACFVLPLAGAVAFGAASSVTARFGAGSDEVPSWTEDVRPILSEHCFACHGPDPEARASGLRLDTLDGMVAGSVLDLAAPEESELIYRVVTDVDFDHMPPPEAGRALLPEEVDVLRRWMESGAEWEPHWAYAPFAEEGETEDENGAAACIDDFVEAALARVDLALSSPAPPRDLLRRVYFDVIGLPPSADVIAAFEADPSEEAYAAHVDRLLASTEFGEHWARHWLDIARYADSHGYTIDGGRSIWPWRDWVVEAIAGDLPFDQFTIQQLAGDLLPDATRDSIIATGFHRNTQVNQEGGAKDEENRINAVIDRVATTGSVWLGSSVACAQCHTHKFDPITHTEYYQLFAFFNSTEDGGVSSEPSLLVPQSDGDTERAARWEGQLAAAEDAYAREWNAASEGWTLWQPERATGSNGPELRPEISGAYRVLGQSPVFSTYVLEGPAPGADRVASVRLEVLADGGPGRYGRNFVLQDVRVASRKVGETEWEAHGLASARSDFDQDTSATGGNHYPAASIASGEGPGWAVSPQLSQPHVIELVLDRAIDMKDRELRLELVQEFGDQHTIGAFRLGLAAEASERPPVTKEWIDAWTALKKVRDERPRMPSTLVMRERSVPRVTRRFERGSFLDQREEVSPGVPDAFDHFSDGAPMSTRLDLARWLVHPANALVHRVTVNRWWQQLFGTGLVPTENDFGLRGVRPTHPELLEWLARDFVEHGMSRRHTLRTMLLSRTYRQSPDPEETRREVDPKGTQLSWRAPRRLSGEVLRDSMLKASGLLDATVGGGPVQPPQPPGVFAFTQSRKKWEPSEGSARFRRSLYTRIWRSSPFPFFTTLDAPSPGFSCTRRTSSRSPLQALALANDPLVIELAKGMGDRLLAELPESAWVERAGAAYRLALGRPATAGEAELLAAHARRIADQRGDAAAAAALSRVVFNLYEFTHRP